MVGGGRPLLPEILGHPHLSEIADFQPIIARSASAVTPSEKSSIKANSKSTTRFPMSLRLTSYVVALKPPKGVLKKTQNGRFPCKIALHLKKVCYKVSLCENSQRQKCKAFIDLCIPVEMIGRGASHCRQKFGRSSPTPCKWPIFSLFSLVAP